MVVECLVLYLHKNVQFACYIESENGAQTKANRIKVLNRQMKNKTVSSFSVGSFQ